MVRPYKTWGYPFAPAIFLILSLFLILDLAYLAGNVWRWLSNWSDRNPAYLIWRNRCLRQWIDSSFFDSSIKETISALQAV
jgi:hypothetical protein